MLSTLQKQKKKKIEVDIWAIGLLNNNACHYLSRTGPS